VRILANFMYRDGWSVRCLAEDAKTSIGRPLTMQNDATLLKLFRFIGAGEEEIAEVERDIKRWGRGSVWIDLTEPGGKLLGILTP
jgi:hypothetical protein